MNASSYTSSAMGVLHLNATPSTMPWIGTAAESSSTSSPGITGSPWHNESNAVTPTTLSNLTGSDEPTMATVQLNITTLFSIMVSSSIAGNFSDYNGTDVDSTGGSYRTRERLLTAQQTFILNVFIGAVGVVGNAFVCFVFARVRKLRTLANIFIINQSIVDLCTSTVFLTKKCMPRNVVIPRGISGDILCKFWQSGFVVWSLVMVSSSNLTALTLERYFAIVHPVRHRHSYTLRKARVAIFFVWLSGFAAELFWAFANYNTGAGRCSVKWYSYAAKKASGVLYFCLEWGFPMSVMAFTYVSILVVLKRRTNTKLKLTKGSNSDRIMERACRNVTKTLVTVSVVYSICWTPQAWEYFLYSVTDLLPNVSPIEEIAILLAFSNMCVNPFIYSLQFRPFREGIVKAFNCRKNKDPATPKTGIENISMSISNEQP